MKMINYLFGVAFLLSNTSLMQAQEKWSLSGQFTGEKTFPKQLYVAAFSFPEETYQVIDSIPVKASGQFSWEGDLEAANLFQLQFGDTDVRLAVDQAEAIRLQFTPNEAGWKAKVEGSAGTNLMYQFPEKLNDLQAHYFGDLKTQLDKALAEKDEATIEAIQQKVGELFPLFVADLKAAVDHLGSSVAVFAAMDYVDGNKGLDIIEAATAKMQAEQPQLAVTQAMVERLARIKGIPIGSLAPAITGTTITGQNISLSDYKGNYVYIDFWASWCLACRAENPELVKLYKKYQSQSFDMLGVAIQDKQENWMKAIEKDGLLWPQISDVDQRIAETYQVMSLPQNILLDPAGKIIARNLKAKELGDRLAELLGKDN
ncbi:MAG: TlpA disulfide reductase family protein [Saprospiraceae bacterium]